MHSKEFRDYPRYWIEQYVRVYGFDVVYLDVFSFRPKYQEYNPFLGLYGDGTEGVLRSRFLVELLERYPKRADSPFFIITEGVTDVYNLHAGGLVSNFSRALSGGVQPTVAFRYLFPDTILYEGDNNGWWNYPKNVLSIAHAFLNGNRFDLLFPFAFHNEVREMVWLRECLLPYLNGSSFEVPNRGELTLPDGVEARLFKKERSLLITLFNAEKKGARC